MPGPHLFEAEKDGNPCLFLEDWRGIFQEQSLLHLQVAPTRPFLSVVWSHGLQLSFHQKDADLGCWNVCSCWWLSLSMCAINIGRIFGGVSRSQKKLAICVCDWARFTTWHDADMNTLVLYKNHPKGSVQTNIQTKLREESRQKSDKNADKHSDKILTKSRQIQTKFRHFISDNQNATQIGLSDKSDKIQRKFRQIQKNQTRNSDKIQTKFRQRFWLNSENFRHSDQNSLTIQTTQTTLQIAARTTVVEHKKQLSEKRVNNLSLYLSLAVSCSPLCSSVVVVLDENMTSREIRFLVILVVNLWFWRAMWQLHVQV